MKIQDLKHDEANARVHSDDNLDAIAHSISEYGFNRPVVIDEDNVILAGNGVIEATRDIGLDNVRVIEADGDEIVAVQVKHLSDEQKRLYAIADNRAAELAGWDTDVLSAQIEAGADIDGLWYTDELSSLIGYAPEDKDTAEANARREENAKAVEEHRAKQERILVCPECFHEWSIDATGADDED